MALPGARAKVLPILPAPLAYGRDTVITIRRDSLLKAYTAHSSVFINTFIGFDLPAIHKLSRDPPGTCAGGDGFLLFGYSRFRQCFFCNPGIFHGRVCLAQRLILCNIHEYRRRDKN